MITEATKRSTKKVMAIVGVLLLVGAGFWILYFQYVNVWNYEEETINATTNETISSPYFQMKGFFFMLLLFAFVAIGGVLLWSWRKGKIRIKWLEGILEKRKEVIDVPQAIRAVKEYMRNYAGKEVIVWPHGTFYAGTGETEEKLLEAYMVIQSTQKWRTIIVPLQRGYDAIAKGGDIQDYPYESEVPLGTRFRGLKKFTPKQPIIEFPEFLKSDDILRGQLLDKLFPKPQQPQPAQPEQPQGGERRWRGPPPAPPAPPTE